MIHAIILSGLALLAQDVQPADPALASPAAPAPVSFPAPVMAPAPFGSAAALDPASLDRETAREDVAQIATAEQAARVSNNSINGPSQTGTVSIDGNAFQNLQGLAVINANSGNNVAINSSLNVNIHFAPGQ